MIFAPYRQKINLTSSLVVERCDVDTYVAGSNPAQSIKAVILTALFFTIKEEIELIKNN